MAPKVPTRDKGTATLGMMVAASERRKEEDDEHDERDGEHQLELNVVDRSLDTHR